MRNFIKAFCFINLSIAPFFLFANNIYTWRSGNGNVVFSQTAPIFEEEYERVGVNPTNRLGAQSLAEEQLSTIRNNSPTNEQMTNQNSNKSQNNILRVKILSPTKGSNIFVHNEKLAIVLDPSLGPDDHPIFIVNGIPTPAHFQNKTWMINRPNPGPVTISVRGSTADNKMITTSSDTDFGIRRVLGRS
ncbi:DUF4124 domain-containing protein [Francisella frigiditurris]|uniref:DUF4124 domain-containing protein n=1 Tax=Francisella frigiditurris TaxID=1542390 RepID=A0A1J0KUM1_9GAMM|nr:DUF4124 domain-containing protein [Francisella frigiditurris]APC97387.1 hypothetical protein KX01_71 [Francisella frigiditurris]